MKRFLVAALLAALSVTGFTNRSEAQVRVRGTLITPNVRLRVGTPYYEHRYYSPYYGYRRYYYRDDDYRRVWVPGFWNDNDDWVPGHYEWIR
jgi:hypothetical protein